MPIKRLGLWTGEWVMPTDAGTSMRVRAAALAGEAVLRGVSVCVTGGEVGVELVVAEFKDELDIFV